MLRFFKTAETKETVDVIDHCVKKMKEDKNVKIFVGTDSQNRTNTTAYITVIVFRSGTRGASFIYRETSVDKIKDRFTKLFKECEDSLEIAEWIQKNSSVRIEAIELDYNSKKTKSTMLVKPAVGWVESMGYKAIIKPKSLLSIRAADHLLKLKKKEADIAQG